MNIWIVNPYGELPSEGWREYRSIMLAEALARRGHNVTWWISDFIHRSKTYRSSDAFQDPLLPVGVKVIGVHSTEYKKNISWSRIKYEVNYGKELVRLAENEPKPDLIVMGDPALFFGKPVLKYRMNVGCKLVLDVIDLWPELFTVALPKFLQPLDRLIFWPLYRRRSQLIAKCDGVVSVCRDYLKAALKGRPEEGVPSLVSYLGIDVAKFECAPLNQQLDENLEKFCRNAELVVVYAGTLGDAYDMDIIARTVKYVRDRNLSIRFIVAGDGPRREVFLRLAEDCPEQIKFLGALPASDLKTLYKNCDVGLITYMPGSTVAMPVKFFDYLAAGLAVISSLDRDIKEVILNQFVGLNYQPSSLESLVERLEWLLINKETLFEYKKNARILADKFDSKVQHDSFAGFVERVGGVDVCMEKESVI